MADADKRNVIRSSQHDYSTGRVGLLEGRAQSRVQWPSFHMSWIDARLDRVIPSPSIPAAVRSYLSTIGVKRDSVSFPSLTLGSVSIELYDLSDPTRLRATTADVFPVPPMPTDPRPGRRDWTRPDSGSPSR
jgi:hypothetical protein